MRVNRKSRKMRATVNTRTLPLVPRSPMIQTSVMPTRTSNASSKFHGSRGHEARSASIRMTHSIRKMVLKAESMANQRGWLRASSTSGRWSVSMPRTRALTRMVAPSSTLACCECTHRCRPAAFAAVASGGFGGSISGGSSGAASGAGATGTAAAACETHGPPPPSHSSSLAWSTAPSTGRSAGSEATLASGEEKKRHAIHRHSINASLAREP
mmetsp:Transcript_150340/g.418916  ORF Transcript_150340/g.418916 Transcript_150340/m.418916 type:complete len:213 (+) Transcript_150340:1259-1897(+)